MNADTVILRVKQYNEQNLDNATDTLIYQFNSSVDEVHSRGDGLQFVPARYLVFPLLRIENDYSEFALEDVKIYFEEKEIEGEGFKPFAEYFEEHKDEGIEILGVCQLNEPSESILLKSFIETLERKGFKCYIEENSKQIVIVLEIK